MRKLELRNRLRDELTILRSIVKELKSDGTRREVSRLLRHATDLLDKACRVLSTHLRQVSEVDHTLGRMRVLIIMLDVLDRQSGEIDEQSIRVVAEFLLNERDEE